VSRAEIRDALVRLDDLTRRLRAECPWDREQDERSIVPHTVEEAYELADAAQSGDDAKLLDELGDVLFQVHFLSLLMEERGAGDLARVADHCHDKLVRRHPHVFSPGELEHAGLRQTRTAGDVLSNWEAIKSSEDGREAGIFGEIPQSLPGPLLARKAQRRAAATGFDLPEAQDALTALQGGVAALEDCAGAEPGSGRPFDEVGDVLFAAVNVARRLHVDPELSLRAASARFQARVELAERLADGAGERWNDLDFDAQLTYYAKARLTPEDR
jgi:XTP/dITP diphosphohydrolase/tetrapyrrole methylase family protein/MazG family protein/ATP diphosphatase